MAMSIGQEKGNGHSHGPLGHGGHFPNSHLTSKSNSHKSNPHVMGSELGHTMTNSHGGAMSMGC
jgi:hypothetical protein